MGVKGWICACFKVEGEGRVCNCVYVRREEGWMLRKRMDVQFVSRRREEWACISG